MDKEESEKDKKIILREEKAKKKERKRKKIEEVRKVENVLLRKVTVKIKLKRVNIQEKITVKLLLNSGATDW